MFRLQILFLLISTISAYTVLPQRASYFVGRDVNTNTQNQQQSRNNGAATIEMKKGKANVSPQMRQQYKRAQEMEGYRQQMIDSQTAGADGFPVFNLFVRTPLKNVSFYIVVLYCGPVLIANVHQSDGHSSIICSQLVRILYHNHTTYSTQTSTHHYII